MRIAITGAGGQLGKELIEVLGRGTDEVLALESRDLDVTDGEEVVKTLVAARPDVVIHAAAFTNVDACEAEPEKAYLVNALGARNVAVACGRIDAAQGEPGAAMVYVSTDFVFDGEKQEPYREFDEARPLSVYGKSKLAGEKYVASLLPRHYIIRTSWLYGRHGRNFVKTVLELAAHQPELRIVSDQVGSPTYARDLAEVIARLIRTPFCGVYQVSNSGSCSWFEFAGAILRLAGLADDVPVRAITSDELGRPARRPAFSVMSHLALEATLGVRMRSWQEALAEYLESSSPEGTSGKKPNEERTGADQR